MTEMMLATLSSIRTVRDMIVAFRDEEHCRRLLESMVWPDGRVCPACGYKRSIAIAGRDVGKRRARPGLYQCSSSDCRFQFTVTTHTPMHRARMEQAVGKLKRFKRVALHCEKTKRNFSALVSIAAAFILIKSVHTT